MPPVIASCCVFTSISNMPDGEYLNHFSAGFGIKEYALQVLNSCIALKAKIHKRRAESEMRGL